MDSKIIEDAIRKALNGVHIETGRTDEFDHVVAKVTKGVVEALSTIKPFGYFHELMDHNKVPKPNGVFLGCHDERVTKMSHIPGETCEHVFALYAAPPYKVPFVPMDAAQRTEAAKKMDSCPLCGQDWDSAERVQQLSKYNGRDQ
jgi:hypothetical protein